jgi:hypothetical protein
MSINLNETLIILNGKLIFTGTNLPTIIFQFLVIIGAGRS